MMLNGKVVTSRNVEFKTGDQVEAKMASGRWHLATYIAKRPDNKLNILCLNEHENLSYQAIGDIHCFMKEDEYIRALQCCGYIERKCHCCCKCPLY